jgi:hypothetical protein
VLSPSSEGARALLDFFQQVDGATGVPVFTFPGTETRFLGDLYQDLSEAVRKRYALLQTPDFVEKFILEQTLDAGHRGVRPRRGEAHRPDLRLRPLPARRLPGAARRWQAKEPTTHVEELARRALDQVYGVDINPYAVAIARFRLVLAVLDAVGITRLDKGAGAAAARRRRGQPAAPDEGTAASVVGAALDGRAGELGRRALPARRARDRGCARTALPRGGGNPPYITEKDAFEAEAVPRHV